MKKPPHHSCSRQPWVAGKMRQAERMISLASWNPSFIFIEGTVTTPRIYETNISLQYCYELVGWWKVSAVYVFPVDNRLHLSPVFRRPRNWCALLWCVRLNSWWLADIDVLIWFVLILNLQPYCRSVFDFFSVMDRIAIFLFFFQNSNIGLILNKAFFITDIEFGKVRW